MIVGKLTDLAGSGVYSEKLQTTFELLKEVDFSRYSAGRHELDNGLFFFVNEYETKEASECFWEAHQKYLDFHYILVGTENIAVDHINNQQVTEIYDEAKDATFFKGDVSTLVTLNPGDVMICFPEDSHMAGVVAGEKQSIRKIVMKVIV
ncbi:DUF386 domain-containing protein [Bacillus sp. DNRA2]|uniref:YhcH/YjgK/YiaL family protein n=1 Tax=Bacillus sp. DNRA2 TaxID=2723053 RepID=UPI00145DA9DB|nr:YhcH/YjgK/YiaL family protein [Bacillus sp. DNRA2]NMD72317.1 DUF386 domain-containing protein [Bacillus sp. DNRA2]